MMWVVGVLLWVRRSRVLFTLTVRHGNIEAVAGRIATGMLHDLEDVFATTRASVDVRVTVERDTVVVRVKPQPTKGPDRAANQALEQRIRNVVGIVPLARLRTAPRR